MTVTGPDHHAAAEGDEPPPPPRPFVAAQAPRVTRSRRRDRAGGAHAAGTLRRGPLVAVAAVVLLTAGAIVVFSGTGTPQAQARRPERTAAPVIDYGTVPTSAAASPTEPAGTGSPTPAVGTTTARPVPPRVNPPATPRIPAASSSGPGAVAAAPPPATFTGLSGEGCPQTTGAGYFRQGWASDWYSGSGGWTGNGCSGASVHVPMSGSTTADDLDNVIVWWFSTATVTRGSCELSVYVPNTGRVLDSAGEPATYQVFGSTSVSGTPIASFTVTQTTHQGAWMGAGSYSISSGQLAVRMMTRGVDWGTGRDGAHLGVSALRVRCQAG